MIRLRFAATIVTLLALTILAGCSTTKPRTSGAPKAPSSAYTPPSSFTETPDAVPQIEHYHKGTSKPYVVFGKRYVPIKPDKPFTQRGMASWYGKKFNGNKTASGEPFNMYAMTAAHRTLPIPSFARVTRVSTGKSIVVKINDRGPFHSKRIIDLSYAAAAKLGLVHDGKGQVIVQAITNDDIRDGDHRVSDSSQTNSQPSSNADKPALSPEKKPASNRTKPVPSLTVKTVASAAPQPGPAAQPDGSTYLQFGAFSSKHNAQDLLQRLNQQLEQADGNTVHIASGGKLYRVQLGPFQNRTAAVNAALRIRQKTGVASTITSHHAAAN